MRKSVIITGASSGIGRALALELAGRGCALGLSARREANLQDVRDEIKRTHADARVELARLDVCDAELPRVFRALAQRLGRVDIVVANAGINELTKVGAGDTEPQRRIVETNLIGAIATVDAAVALFREQGSGHVVGISSLAALFAIPKQAAYCASKAGFTMYLNAARLELKRKNIVVTDILPGFIKTDIMDDIGKYPFAVSPEQCAREIADCIDKKRAVGIVPRMPWRMLVPLLRHAPNTLLERLM